MRPHDRATRQESADPLGVEYRILDAAALPADLEIETFDMATSCLALQDMPDVPRVLNGVRALLRPGARFVASITHPCTDTPLRQWEHDADGGKRWLCIDRYFEQGPLQFEWSGWGRTSTEGRVPWRWMRILDTGFALRGCEPRPTAERPPARRSRMRPASLLCSSTYCVREAPRPGARSRR